MECKIFDDIRYKVDVDGNIFITEFNLDGYRKCLWFINHFGNPDKTYCIKVVDEYGKEVEEI